MRIQLILIVDISKSFKKFVNLVSFDPDTCISDLNLQIFVVSLFNIIESIIPKQLISNLNFHLYWSVLGKLQGIRL